MGNLRDEAMVGTDALQAFVEEWGDMTIPYNRLVLEIVLEELFTSGVYIVESNPGASNEVSKHNEGILDT